MAYLGFTEDRIYEAAVNRQLNRNGSDVSPNGYRFGRIGVNRARGDAGRTARGVKGFFSMMLELIAAAKTRRIEREMRFAAFATVRSSWMAIGLLSIKTRLSGALGE